MTKNNLKVVKSAKNQDTENKEKNKALDAAISQITDTFGKGSVMKLGQQKAMDVASSWSKLQSSKSFLESVRLQVKAAEIANEGITVEYETGLGRTTLDLIQSNSLLLDARISLADAERNYLLNQFKFLQSIGLLNTNHLKIQ